MGRPGLTVLGVVTARAGSRGLPGKNTRPLAGRPLIAYTIDAAVESGVFDRLILSTDDPNAATIARERGCEVPFTRPAELAADGTPHLPVMQHALQWLEANDGYTPEWVVILQPTSPLRQPKHLREAVALAVDTGADSVVGVTQVPMPYHPLRVLAVNEQGWASPFVGGGSMARRVARRLDLGAAWVPNGAVYVLRRGLLFDRAEPSLYGQKVALYPMEARYSVDIDGPEDWAAAEQAIAELTAK